MTAFDDLEETPINTGNEEMNLNDGEAASHISYKPPPYNARYSIRGEINLVHNADGNPHLKN